MKYTLITTLALWLQIFLWAQTPIIFMPGPGNNDGTDQGSLTGGKDTYVLEVNPSTNYGDGTVVYSFPITTCNSWNQIGLIQFDLSTLPLAVDSVFLHFWSWDLNTYCYSNCDNNWKLWYVGEPWDEMTATWNDQPVIDSAFAGPFNVVFPRVGTDERYEITSAYRNWKSGSVPNYGVALKPIDGGCSNAAVSFGGYSSDDTTFGGTHRPYLEIYATSVGLTETISGLNEVTVYPNPASTTVSMQYFQQMPGTTILSVLDPMGRMVLVDVKERTSGPVFQQFDLTNFPSGIYQWHLSTPDGISCGAIIRQ